MGPRKNPPRRLLAYTRVSTSEQSTHGHSLTAQRERIEAWCRLHGAELVGIEEDPGQSAGDLDRPGLQRVLDRLVRGEADGLVVSKLDRLTRRVRHLGELVDGPCRKAALVSVGESIDTKSAGGRLVLNVLASVAEWERDAIRERTREVLHSKRARGERVSRFAPFGRALSHDGRLIPDRGEEITLQTVRTLHGGGMSVRKIAAELTRRRAPCRGKRWHATTVQRILGRQEAQAA